INPLPIYSAYNGHIHDMGTSSGIASSISSGEGMSAMNAIASSTSLQNENLPASSTSALSFKEGMYVQSGQVLFAVYNTSRVWVVLNIFPRDAALIKVGDKVSIASETNPTNSIHTTIDYIEPVTSGDASAIRARVYLENAEKFHLRIGTLVN